MVGRNFKVVTGRDGNTGCRKGLRWTKSLSGWEGVTMHVWLGRFDTEGMKNKVMKNVLQVECDSLTGCVAPG